MLKDKSSSAIIAVSDLDRARRFYRDTLGLPSTDDNDEMSVFKTGNTDLIVYKSEEAGSNKANAVVWGVGDEIDAITDDLKSKQVKFLHYPDMEGVTLDGDTHRAGDMKLVWFEDPDGNILHINNM